MHESWGCSHYRASAATATARCPPTLLGQGSSSCCTPHSASVSPPHTAALGRSHCSPLPTHRSQAGPPACAQPGGMHQITARCARPPARLGPPPQPPPTLQHRGAPCPSGMRPWGGGRRPHAGSHGVVLCPPSPVPITGAAERKRLSDGIWVPAVTAQREGTVPGHVAAYVRRVQGRTARRWGHRRGDTRPLPCLWAQTQSTERGDVGAQRWCRAACAAPSLWHCEDSTKMCHPAQVAAAFCSHPLCHLHAVPWRGPQQRGATCITAASLRSHAATASFQAPPPPGLRHGMGGHVGTPPPQRVLPQPGDKGHKVLGQRAKRRHQNLPPTPDGCTEQEHRSALQEENSTLWALHHPNTAGLGRDECQKWGDSVWMGKGNGRDWGTQRLQPPSPALQPQAPPQLGSCRIRSALPLFNTSGGAGGVRGLRGQAGPALRPQDGDTKPTAAAQLRRTLLGPGDGGTPRHPPTSASPHSSDGANPTASGGTHQGRGDRGGGCSRHHPPVNSN